MMSLPAANFNQKPNSDWYNSALEKLVGVVQELSHCRDVDAVMAIVRMAARELTGADGATLVLRDGDFCHYADENAIQPLWKGKRFPMAMCISGWVMMNAQSVTIEDIYKDSRIPVDAYRPTFVKSIAMVPIRRHSPIGAIGNYWARNRHPSAEEVAILQALADTTSVALENAQLYRQLQGKVQALQKSNDELSHFAWVASHDLQEPLRTISVQMGLLKKRYELDEKASAHVDMAIHGAERLQDLIKDILVHSSAREIKEYRPVDTNNILADTIKSLSEQIGESGAKIVHNNLPVIYGEKEMLFRVFLNLISNALKFRRQDASLVINVNAEQKSDYWQFTIEDNGIGIEPQYLEKIFALFQRLNSREDYNGSGIGLATCKKIVEMHGGQIWAESKKGVGSVFRFTLPTIEKQLSGSATHENIAG